MNRELYQKYFRKNNKGLVLLILIIGVGTVVNGLNPYIYGKIIDSISGKNIIILKKWLLCLGIVLIVTLILETVESLIGNWLTNIIENQIKNDLFAHITIMECKNLDIYEEGELFNKIEFDAENIVSYYLDFITSILMIVFNLGISVYFILNISKKLAAITFITIPVLYLINFIFHRKVYLINQKIRQFTDKYYSFLNDSLSEIISIKTFGLEKDISKLYNEYLKEKMCLFLKSIVLSKGIGVIRGSFGNTINVIILFVAGLLIIAGNMTIGMLVSFSSYMEKFFEAVSKIMELNLNKQQVMVCYERIKDILDSEQEENKGIILERPVQKIEFNQVVFGYNDNLVLKEMWISITKTGLYSLVGSNGCGKSTIFKLLERFYECKDGEIEINQVPINKYSVLNLRSHIVYISKKPFFLQGTIMDNLKLGQNEISDLEVIEACKKVGIHSDIQKLEKGYYELIESGGENFSSGQKQKLGFARVLLKKADIVLLDEVTSDLDGEAERQICNQMEEIAKKAIVLNIAHKPESIRRSEKVFFIQGGKIAAEGTHKTLMKNCVDYKKIFTSDI